MCKTNVGAGNAHVPEAKEGESDRQKVHRPVEGDGRTRGRRETRIHFPDIAWGKEVFFNRRGTGPGWWPPAEDRR